MKTYTSKQIFRTVTLQPGEWFWNAAPLGVKPRWIIQPIPQK